MADWRSWRRRAWHDVLVLNDSRRDIRLLVAGLRRWDRFVPIEDDLLFVTADGSLRYSVGESALAEVETENGRLVFRDVSSTTDSRGQTWQWESESSVAMMMVNARQGVTAGLQEQMRVVHASGVRHLVIAEVSLELSNESGDSEAAQLEAASLAVGAGFDIGSIRFARVESETRESVQGLISLISEAAQLVDAQRAEGIALVAAEVDVVGEVVLVHVQGLVDGLEPGAVLEVFGSGERYLVTVKDVSLAFSSEGESDVMSVLQVVGQQSPALRIGDVLATRGWLWRSSMFEAWVMVSADIQHLMLENPRVNFHGSAVPATVIDSVPITLTSATPVRVTIAVDDAIPLSEGMAFQLDIGADAPVDAVVATQLHGMDEDAKVVTVWYGTNRIARPGGAQVGFHNGPGDTKLHYGACAVRVPASHRFGSTGAGFWKRLWRPGIKDGRLTLEEIRPNRDRREFAAHIREALEVEATEKRALVFIHGYKTSFEEAAVRAAQFEADLNLPGLTAFFSWPSHDAYHRYPADRDRAEESVPYLIEFLTTLVDEARVERIDLIVHSMGNQLVTDAVESLARNPHTAHIRFGVVALAAPDVATTLFKRKAPDLVAQSNHTNMYVSGRDWALRAAQLLQAGPRAGARPPVTVVGGIDTIEATEVDLSVMGHDYYGGSHPVLYDMWATMTGELDPARRLRLDQESNAAGERYWKIRV